MTGWSRIPEISKMTKETDSVVLKLVQNDRRGFFVDVIVKEVSKETTHYNEISIELIPRITKLSTF